MIKKISTKELRPGMTVARMQSDVWYQCPYLYTREGVVASAEEVQDIIDEGFLEVFIDTGAEPEGESGSEGEPFAPGPSVVGIFEELDRARELYANAVLVAGELFVAASRGRVMDMDAARQAVDGLHGSLARNPSALGCLARLSDGDAYLYSHSVNVAVLGMYVALCRGLDSEEVRRMGLAGLFHDLGKTRLPMGLLNRSARLSPAESKVMEGHCVHGLAILEAQRDVPRSVKRAVVEHHERFDGKGYPFGLQDGQISPAGRMLALADCFDALTSKRTYKEAMPPSKALSIMYGMRDKDFAAKDVDRFIKVLGVYPSGSLVQLDSGEIGVVCDVDPARPLVPLVNVVLNKRFNPVTPYLKDLGSAGASSSACTITRYVDADTLEHDPLRLMLA